MGSFSVVARDKKRGSESKHSRFGLNIRKHFSITESDEMLAQDAREAGVSILENTQKPPENGPVQLPPDGLA